MNGQDSNPNNSDVGPDEAQHILDDVSALTQSVEWKPNAGVITLLAVVFAAAVTTGVWDLIGWVFALLALLMILVAVFRKQLVNPYARPRPWQDLEQEGGAQGRNWWSEAAWVLWVPLTIVVPPEPRWLGLIAGVLAGVHIHYALRKA